MIGLLLILLIIFLPSLFYSEEKVKLTPEQKKELASQVGIILPDMTKQEVRETFGLLEPEVWYTPEGQEVWYYNSPEEQDIYFKGDKVERVEYYPKKPIEQELKKDLDIML